jgi:poly(3-hydroxybutyrate) depolymerase
MKPPAILVSLALAGLAPVAARGQAATGDQWLAHPVDDATFSTFLDFFKYDHGLPFDTRVTGSENTEGITIQRLSFQSTPGETVTALLYQPPAPSGRAVVMLHGGTATGKDGASYRLWGRLVARAGFVVLALDMKYFGERNTGLLTTFTEQDKHEHLYNQPSTYLDWIAQTVKDAGRSLDFLVREQAIDPKRIALLGLSRGAQVGMIVGGADGRFAAVALVMGGHFDALETSHLAAACPANYIGRIAPRPVFLLNGENDADYKKEPSVLPLHRLAREPKTIRWTPGGHFAFTDEDYTAVVSWLERHVP